MQKSKISWFTLGGMLLGYLLIHPFAMLANTLAPACLTFPWNSPSGATICESPSVRRC